MFEYMKVLFAGMWSKAFWIDRWNTFRAMIRKPGDFFTNVGKKEWDRDAYLLGLSAGFLEVILFSFLLAGFVGLFSGWVGIKLLLCSLIVGLIGWFVGAFLMYYAGTWLFAFALKLVTKKNETAKIRPILFTLCPSGVFGLFPGFGGILSLVAIVYFLMVAYEKGIKVERGPGVASAILGVVFTGIAAMVPGFLFGAMISALYTGMSWSTIALLLHMGSHSTVEASKEAAPKGIVQSQPLGQPDQAAAQAAVPTLQAMVPTVDAQAAKSQVQEPKVPSSVSLPETVKARPKKIHHVAKARPKAASPQVASDSLAPDDGSTQASASTPASDTADAQPAASSKDEHKDVVADEVKKDAVDDAADGAKKLLGF